MWLIMAETAPSNRGVFFYSCISKLTDCSPLYINDIDTNEQMDLEAGNKLTPTIIITLVVFSSVTLWTFKLIRFDVCQEYAECFSDAQLSASRLDSGTVFTLFKKTNMRRPSNLGRIATIISVEGCSDQTPVLFCALFLHQSGNQDMSQKQWCLPVKQQQVTVWQSASVPSFRTSRQR